jgi:hypothetical protein
MTIAQVEEKWRTRVTELEAEVSTLKEKLEYAEAVAGIRRGQEDAAKELGKPLRQVDQEHSLAVVVRQRPVVQGPLLTP